MNAKRFRERTREERNRKIAERAIERWREGNRVVRGRATRADIKHIRKMELEKERDRLMTIDQLKIVKRLLVDEK